MAIGLLSKIQYLNFLLLFLVGWLFLFVYDMIFILAYVVLGLNTSTFSGNIIHCFALVARGGHRHCWPWCLFVASWETTPARATSTFRDLSLLHLMLLMLFAKFMHNLKRSLCCLIKFFLVERGLVSLAVVQILATTIAWVWHFRDWSYRMTTDVRAHCHNVLIKVNHCDWQIALWFLGLVPPLY